MTLSDIQGKTATAIYCDLADHYFNQYEATEDMRELAIEALQANDFKAAKALANVLVKLNKGA